MNGWRPIETAPNNEDEVLVWCENAKMPRIVWKLAGSDLGWSSYDYRIYMDIAPTHWMPLPGPPTGDES